MDPETVETIARLKAAAAAHPDFYLTVGADDLAALVLAAAPRLSAADRALWAKLAEGAAKSQLGTADLHVRKHLAPLLAAAESPAEAAPDA